MMRVPGGKPFSIIRLAMAAAKSAATPYEKSLCATNETAREGIPKIVPSMAAETVPPPELPRIPQWVKLNGDWWTTNQISDSEFLEGIAFLFEKQVISVPERDVVSESQWKIPQWVKNPVGWWYEEKISDDELLNIIENLVKREIIIV